MIEAYRFGAMTVRGVRYTDDLKIIGGKVIPHWWRREGHRLREEDIPEVLEGTLDLLVVGTGFFGMMRVEKSLRETLERRGVRLLVDKTGRAVTLFNEAYREANVVAGVFHLTC